MCVYVCVCDWDGQSNSPPGCHISETREAKKQKKKVNDARQSDKSGRGQRVKQDERDNSYIRRLLTSPCSPPDTSQHNVRKGLNTDYASLSRYSSCTRWRFLSAVSFLFYLLVQKKNHPSPFLPVSSAGVTLPFTMSEWEWRESERGNEWNEEKDARAKRAASSCSWQHMPQVCLECKQLFLEPHGYFYICAGWDGGRKFSLWFKSLSEEGIRKGNVSAWANSACAWC